VIVFSVPRESALAANLEVFAVNGYHGHVRSTLNDRVRYGDSQQVTHDGVRSADDIWRLYNSSSGRTLFPPDF
jgi:hypothetical protein